VNSKPVMFTAIVVLMMLCAFAYHLRTQGIFACNGSVYGQTRFLAYCNSLSYRDYDQGSFWHQLDESAYRHARQAQVLFIGNSKLQFALSTQATSDWFAQRSTSHFLFGFAHNETVRFFSPVLAAMKPQARVIVIHVDRLFEDRLTPPMTILANDPGSRRIFRTKKVWQRIHRPVCSFASELCGQNFGLHRNMENGHWLFTGTQGRLDQPVPTGDGPPLEQERWPDRAQRARDFIAPLQADNRCVLLILIPSQKTRREEALYIADALNLPLISPDVEGLETFDRNHLDEASATRWSTALFETAGDMIEGCLSPQTSLDSEHSH